MDNSYDVIVVGLGAMGSAACYHLAKRGARVLGLEKFDIPHAQGSSHGFSRAIRSSYHEHPDYVPLVTRAFSMWQELEAETEQKLMHVTGCLYLGPIDGEVVGGSLRSARKYNLPYELMDRAALGGRFPQFHVPDQFVGMLEQNAGFIHPEKAVAAHALQAMRRGAELHGREAVTGWTADGKGVTVTTARETYHGGQLLFSGGAWTDKLVRDLGVPLRVTRQVLAWFWPKNPDAFQLGRIPVWSIDRLDGTTHYGFPMMADNPGFKIAHHNRGLLSDPDTVERSPLPGDEEDVREALRKNIPEGEGPLLALRICMYTNTPDLNFIVDRHPQHERVTLACGFSGHGFKFATVMGEVLADLTTAGQTAHPIGFLGLSRFRKQPGVS
jgi:sarcosine oxidase